MKSLLFIAIVLLSGLCAGLLHGGVNLAVVEPYLDIAIGIENQNLFESGEVEDNEVFWNEYYSYRMWQKGGQVFAGALLGVAMGALFGIVFALSRNVLPGVHNIKKAVILAGIMWLTVYFIPFLKYPANPPTVGDPDTIMLRTIFYVSFIALSGLGVIGFYQLAKRIKKHQKIVGLGGYAVFMIAMFVLMPANPDKITAPDDLVDGFRTVSVLGVSTFWISVALILGTFWQKFKPDAPIETKHQ